MTPFANTFLGLTLVGGGALLGGFAIDTLLSPNAPSSADVSVAIEAIAPEAATEDTQKIAQAVDGTKFMMVAAHPAASHVGAAILDEGGSAVDAIIAAQMVLNLVEPQSSGIGGGGFLLVWDPETRDVISYDGRETAPSGGSDLYLRQANGQFRPFFEAVTGGASVGVPGLLRMLELAHQDHGKSDWSALFSPAISLAEDGFPVSPRLNGLLAHAQFLSDMPPANGYFFQDDLKTPRQIGSRITNTEFAETLRRIASGGANAFYTGPLAEALVMAVQNAPRNPGSLSLEDLALYEAKRRAAVCLPFRDAQVCGMGPPSSGGITVAQILGILERADPDIRDVSPAPFQPVSPRAVQIFSDAMRLAFADRNRYLADSDFVDVPVSGLLDDDYLSNRAKQIDLSTPVSNKRTPGLPQMDEASRPLVSDDLSELPATTHLVAVDRNGLVASLTSSIETGFGSRVMVGGFLLNNQLTDFAWRPEIDGAPAANRYQPGKRPRSSMAPTIVLGPDGAPVLAIGSPGGSRIIGYVAKTIVGVLDWHLPLQHAITLPHFLSNNGPIDLEDREGLDNVSARLESIGYQIRRRAMTSGLHGISIQQDGMVGAADPRREGLAVSEKTVSRNLDAIFKDLINGR